MRLLESYSILLGGPNKSIAVWRLSGWPNSEQNDKTSRQEPRRRMDQSVPLEIVLVLCLRLLVGTAVVFVTVPQSLTRQMETVELAHDLDGSRISCEWNVSWAIIGIIRSHDGVSPWIEVEIFRVSFGYHNKLGYLKSTSGEPLIDQFSVSGSPLAVWQKMYLLADPLSRLMIPCARLEDD